MDKSCIWRGTQPGYDDNYTDGFFLQDTVMNANVVKRDILKVVCDSVSISQYLCIVALVVCVWCHTMNFGIDEISILLYVGLFVLGFLVLLVMAKKLSLHTLYMYILNICFFTCGLYILEPIYQTLTRSVSCDCIWALMVCLLIFHLLLHDYSGSTVKPPGALNNPTLTGNLSLNTSIVASVLIASRSLCTPRICLPSRELVFSIMLFSLQIFLYSPLIMYCVKRYSFKLHLVISFILMGLALCLIFPLYWLFSLFLSLLFFVYLICPYWLIKIQACKFEINGPCVEAKLWFGIKE